MDDLLEALLWAPRGEIDLVIVLKEGLLLREPCAPNQRDSFHFGMGIGYIDLRLFSPQIPDQDLGKVHARRHQSLLSTQRVKGSTYKFSSIGVRECLFILVLERRINTY
jgi:hypothetical protein